MRQSRAGIAVLVFLGSLFGSVIGVAADASALVNVFNDVRAQFYQELCIGGSGTIMENELGLSTAMAEAVAFPVNPLRLTVYTDGSGAAIRRAVEGKCLHVLLTTDPLDNNEQARLAQANVTIDCATVFAYDVIALVTSRDVRVGNPNNPLQLREVRAILNGSITNWAQVRGDDMPITVIAQLGRTMRYMMQRVAGFASTPQIPYPPGANYLLAEGTNDMPLSELLNTPGSLTWMSAAWMRLQPLDFFNVVSVLDELRDERSVNPLTDRVNLDMYPRDLLRPLYVYAVVSPTASDELRLRTRQFVQNMLRGVVGQQLVIEHGFFPYFDAPRDVSVTLPTGFTPDKRCRPWDIEASLLQQHGALNAVLPVSARN